MDMLQRVDIGAEKQYLCTRKTSRGGAVVARWAHNPKVAGSSPAPATNKKADWISAGFFISPDFYIKNQGRLEQSTLA